MNNRVLDNWMGLEFSYCHLIQGSSGAQSLLNNWYSRELFLQAGRQKEVSMTTHLQRVMRLRSSVLQSGTFMAGSLNRDSITYTFSGFTLTFK